MENRSIQIQILTFHILSSTLLKSYNSKSIQICWSLLSCSIFHPFPVLNNKNKFFQTTFLRPTRSSTPWCYPENVGGHHHLVGLLFWLLFPLPPLLDLQTFSTHPYTCHTKNKLQSCFPHKPWPFPNFTARYLRVVSCYRYVTGWTNKWNCWNATWYRLFLIIINFLNMLKGFDIQTTANLVTINYFFHLHCVLNKNNKGKYATDVCYIWQTIL